MRQRRAVISCSYAYTVFIIEQRCCFFAVYALYIKWKYCCFFSRISRPVHNDSFCILQLFVKTFHKIFFFPPYFLYAFTEYIWQTGVQACYSRYIQCSGFITLRCFIRLFKFKRFCSCSALDDMLQPDRTVYIQKSCSLRAHKWFMTAGGHCMRFTFFCIEWYAPESLRCVYYKNYAVLICKCSQFFYWHYRSCHVWW